MKNGAGTLTFANTSANTFSGGPTLNAGTIVLANDTANAGGLGTGPVTLNGGIVSMFDNVSELQRLHRRARRPAGRPPASTPTPAWTFTARSPARAR